MQHQVNPYPCPVSVPPYLVLYSYSDLNPYPYLKMCPNFTLTLALLLTLTHTPLTLTLTRTLNLILTPDQVLFYNPRAKTGFFKSISSKIVFIPYEYVYRVDSFEFY
jgi:hypothetical protein